MARYYDDDYYFPPSRPIETDQGIQATSRRGAFGKNWWATRWIAAMERLTDSGRLSRGRSYARRGQVLSIEETKTGVQARVQGSRPRPYKITIEVKPLTDTQWEQVIDALAEQALFTAKLLSGEMPGDIESAFRSAGVSLFPEKRNELITDCSCPDYANPCKHVAATHYILGERFDEDPFLLFRLRGRNQEQIMQALRQRRNSQGYFDGMEETEPEEALPLEENLAKFYDLNGSLDQFSVAIRAPVIEAPILKRLGDPSFVSDPGLLSILAPAFQAISQAVLKMAFGEEKENSNE